MNIYIVHEIIRKCLAPVFHFHIAVRHEKGLKSRGGVSLHPSRMRTTSRY